MEVLAATKRFAKHSLTKPPIKGIECILAAPNLSTDNASMIALVAALHYKYGAKHKWDSDIDPNLKLAQ